jgi:undecaprenyl-diphosphatase
MSFPSGHSADAVALLLIAATLVTTPGSWTDRVTAWTIPVVPAGVAISTVQLAYHWPTDAIAGWALGLAAGVLARRSLRRT